MYMVHIFLFKKLMRDLQYIIREKNTQKYILSVLYRGDDSHHNINIQQPNIFFFLNNKFIYYHKTFNPHLFNILSFYIYMAHIFLRIIHT